ncbi:flagellar hook assembly protein FlgD [Halomonas pacifica]|uniref:Basal-body rod modification protein FlgD n=1 Tax=Bisbaumannia pacifica TaxID=77098 RepID=A0ABD4L1R1_9GAMM|nr:flagellar hook assembly protein FlgD [Halomonas pacifica]MBH8579901.1 flagellar hook assembly protein FlgD [Halomonas pacifica]MDC8803503.1 flagellar hook assembly protein FlgD [Halomonas pacifica]
MTSPIGNNVLNSVNGGGNAGLGPRQSQELRESFMTLLITQLQNQDPLNPMENAEMTSQLAQINTVSGIEQLNETLDGITSQIDAGQQLQASALIGKGVMVPGNRVLLQTDDEGNAHTTPFGVELAAPADNVTATIVNDSGQVINRYELGAVDAGVHSFSWDGEASDGEIAAPGAYRVRIEATQGEDPVSVDALHYAVVGGVTPSDNGVRLDLGGVYGQVGLDDVKQIL